MAAVMSIVPHVSVHVIGGSGSHATAVGTTRRDTVDGPVQRARVVLHDQRSGRVLFEQWSNASNGQWQFEYIRAGTFFVTAIDPLGLKGGEIVTDIVVPTPPTP